MPNALRGIAAHSAEYFGDTRDHWWNDDYLQTAAGRLGLAGVLTVLDVGCGVGHWSRALLPMLDPRARVIGVDAEEAWVRKATEQAVKVGLADRCSYEVGLADALRAPDDSFDLVTCQTLLIHVQDPARVLAEMVRVVKPGGLLIAAEPTNVHSLLLDSIALEDAPETTASILRFQLVCERGKRALGEGSNLLGEALPGLLVGAGLSEVEVRVNDRAAWMAPPYASPAQQAQVEDLRDRADRGMGIWDVDMTRRYFLAGGGSATEFASSWNEAIALRQRCARAVGDQTFVTAGGGFSYLCSARKPAAPVNRTAPGGG